MKIQSIVINNLNFFEVEKYKLKKNNLTNYENRKQAKLSQIVLESQ
jgi:hypothetical protein